MWSIFLRRAGIFALMTWRSKVVRTFVLNQGKKVAQNQLRDYLIQRRQQKEDLPTHSPTATRIPISYE